MLQHSAQTEHIAPLVGRVSGESFGGGVAAALTACSGWLGPVMHLAEANELHQWAVARCARDEDGVGRQISVDETDFVSCLQTGSRLQDQVYRLVRGDETAYAEHL
jgi:hypothetical protein